MKVQDLLSINTLFVYKQNELAGFLHRTGKGCHFEYTEKYLESEAPPICFHIPKNSQGIKITGDNLPPFFAGLLPEGLRLTALQEVIKTSSSDMFSLLAAIGTDSIGDVHVSPQENLLEDSVVKIQKFSDVNFFEIFQESIYTDEYQFKNLDSSFPGIQPKISGQMISFPLRVAKKKKRYLLKLSPSQYPLLVENENFFMNLAKKCGIESAETQIVYDKNNSPGLLVERFDRVFDTEFRKCHQEDACQFLNKYPQDKYRLSVQEIGKGMQEYVTSPVIEISKFIDILIYSYIIGNGDLHAKNISLGAKPHNRVITITKAYDLLSTLPYGDQRMALLFYGKNDNFTKQMFLKFGEAFRVPQKIVQQSIEKISTTVAENISAIHQVGFENKKLQFLQKVIQKRLQDLE